MMQNTDKSLSGGKSSNKISKSHKKVKKPNDTDGLFIKVPDEKPANMLVNGNHRETNIISDKNHQPKDKPIPKQARSRSRSREKNHTKHFICGICLNFIETDKEVILEKCRDIFCRICLIQEMIQSESDVIRCPSKFANCDNKILEDEMRCILGDSNFEVFTVHRLQMRFERLVEKDKKDYEKM